jgi:hypothetical protein
LPGRVKSLAFAREGEPFYHHERVSHADRG